MFQKFQLQLSAVVGNGREVFENVFDTFANERVVRILLNFNQIGHIENVLDFAESPSLGIAALNLVDFLRHRIAPYKKILKFAPS